jgi:hypothetical protein
MITLDGRAAFCFACGSYDLVIMKEEDELLLSSANDGSKFIVKCLRCSGYFSQVFIEKNIESFTSEDRHAEIMLQRVKLQQHYDGLRNRATPVDINAEEKIEGMKSRLRRSKKRHEVAKTAEDIKKEGTQATLPT